ncbi:hypothetical protein IW147_000358 [Coemansia sp. RSA 720]|nr:hypothetical protein IW147_000358 [Coemansia sp. RSA 720]
MFVAGKKRKTPPAGARAAPSARARTNASLSAASSAPKATEAEINKWYLLGTENARERQYRTSLDYYNRAIALALNENVRNARLYEARAHTLHKLGEYKRAMDDAKEAVIIDGNSTAGFMRIASILAATGKPKDALDVITKGLKTVNAQTSGYTQMDVQRMSIERQLDPTYVPRIDYRLDPIQRLPEDLAVLILQLLDTRTLAICRAVSRYWMTLIDFVPVLWSQPQFTSSNAIQRLICQLPAYVKPRKQLPRQNHNVPECILRHVLEKSRGSLLSLWFPDGSAVTSATVDALFGHRRPRLASVNIGRTAVVSETLINRVLNWTLSSQITDIRLPYRSHIGNEAMEVIAREASALRVLDISGCTKVRVKHMFKAWNAVIADAQGSTALEKLYMNDHPGIPELLVYSTKYRHFSNLKVLHISIRDQGVLSMYAGLGPVMEYLQRITNAQIPFPGLIELNIDGVWDATVASRRFESINTALLISRCRLLCSGLCRLSALDATFVGAVLLHASLTDCFSTLQKLHLTRAAGFDSSMLWTLLSVHQQLPLVSLDLSGCVAVDAPAIAALISRCNNLVHVNLSQTAADNAVMAELTRIVSADDAAGLEVVVLDTTDITGAAARDFASACAKRYVRTRNNKHTHHAWRLSLFDIDNCFSIGSDAVAIVRDLLSFMQTRVLAAAPS